MKELIAREIAKVTSLRESDIVLMIEIPPSSEMGDYSFPCFSIAGERKKNSGEIAGELASSIKSPIFQKVEARGPYLNFYLNNEYIADSILNTIITENDMFGSSKEKKETIMVEFSQANTHKAFHVGHIRGTSIGESLSRIYEFLGKKVIRANYQGDTGMHVAKWLWCYKKYHSREAMKADEPWIASIYAEAIKKIEENPDFQEEVNLINQQLELEKDRELTDLWEKSRGISLKSFEAIYSELNTHFDRQYFESEVEADGKKIVQELDRKGIAKKSDGAVIMDLKKYGLGIWVLLRKDRTVLYSAKDVALALKKFSEYHLDKSINVVADEQNLHFKQLFKTLELMGFKNASKYSHVSFGMVRLPEGKMSSRTGKNILYSEFINDVMEYAKSKILKRENLNKEELNGRALKISIASIKYAMLRQSANNVIIFNKKGAVNFEGNTGPYLLYSYARARSILRRARYKRQKIRSKGISSLEKSLILSLGKFPEIVKHASINLSPNLIANYAFEISQTFNEFYQSEKVIGSGNESLRLCIVDCFSQVLKNSLFLLGIEVLEKM